MYAPSPFLRRPLAPFLFLLLAGALSSADGTRVTFRYRAPEDAASVTLAGAFNDWSTTANPMFDPEGDGVYEIELDIPPGKHPYKYVVDGNRWMTDETASEFADDGYGGRNSVLLVPEKGPVFAGEPPSEGIVPKGTPVLFRFDPGEARANAVSVAGTFNDWNAAAHPMADEDGDGLWEVVIHLAPGAYAYQFVVDGDDWRGDPRAARREPDGFGGENALLEVGDEPVTAGER